MGLLEIISKATHQHKGVLSMTNIDIEVKLENHDVRLDAVEKSLERLDNIVTNIQDITTSVNKLAINMENMLIEQKAQGERIKQLEGEPADTYKLLKRSILTTVISVLFGAVTTAIILAVAGII
jgi:hypothetical protein